MNIQIKQGQPFTFLAEETNILKNLLAKLGVTLYDGLYLAENVCQLPPKKVGIIQLPSRTIIINPRYEEIKINHVIRMYNFVNNFDYNLLNDPDYNLQESFNYIDFTQRYIHELREVIRKGLPAIYLQTNQELNYLKGKIDPVKTQINLLKRKNNPIVTNFEQITIDNPINQILSAALWKIKEQISMIDFVFLSNNLPEPYVKDINQIIEQIKIERNHLYCKKALDLAKIILKELCLSDVGSEFQAEGFLIDYDLLFENFVKTILIYYSGDSGFSTWSQKRKFAEYIDNDRVFNRSYIPDLLYNFSENLTPKAEGIIDAKNKQVNVFANPDIYQIQFYGNLLQAKKLILIYPSHQNKLPQKLIMKFNSNYLEDVYAVYINVTSPNYNQFFQDINLFCQQVIYCLRS